MRPNRAWLSLSLIGTAALFLAGGAPTSAQFDPVEPAPEDEIVASFESERQGPREFVFHWSYEPSEDEENFTCQLNFDGDEVVERSITDCQDVQEATFRYDEPGEYTAVLIVRSRDGGSDLERERVVARPVD